MSLFKIYFFFRLIGYFIFHSLEETYKWLDEEFKKEKHRTLLMIRVERIRCYRGIKKWESNPSPKMREGMVEFYKSQIIKLNWKEIETNSIENELR